MNAVFKFVGAFIVSLVGIIALLGMISNPLIVSGIISSIIGVLASK